jgi:cytochrome c oxidase subunit 2
MSFDNWKNLLLTAVVITTAVGLILPLQATANERVIRISAKKFEYTPHRIVMKQGEHVILEMTAVDRVHGFSIPGMGIHGVIIPDKTLRIAIPTDKPGSYPFLCDIFCGEGHEDMSGIIVIEE